MHLLRRRLSPSMQRVFALLLALLLSSVSVIPTFAQTETGQITVRATDPQGAVVSGATVTVRSIEKGTTFPAVTTSDEGTATITNLQPGLYEVTVSGQGFGNFTQQAQITVGAKLSIEAKLAVTGSGEVVNVVA